MAFNATRIRLMKEKANYDVNVQCNIKYPIECKNKGSRYLTSDEMVEYIKATDKDEYLKSIGKFEMEDC